MNELPPCPYCEEYECEHILLDIDFSFGEVNTGDLDELYQLQEDLAASLQSKLILQQKYNVLYHYLEELISNYKQQADQSEVDVDFTVFLRLILEIAQHKGAEVIEYHDTSGPGFTSVCSIVYTENVSDLYAILKKEIQNLEY